jgi:hypothetical protein
VLGGIHDLGPGSADLALLLRESFVEGWGKA